MNYINTTLSYALLQKTLKRKVIKKEKFSLSRIYA